MNAPSVQPDTRRPVARKFKPAVAIFATILVCFVLFAHPFLAVTLRVEADVLVVEGWIPDYMLPPAAQEFQQGKYRLLIVSGMLDRPAGTPSSPSEAAHTATRLAELGVSGAAIVTCPAPFTRWLRTSKSAKAVRDKIADLGITPKGINILTAGPHGRETWVAYQHIFGGATPIGIISLPRNNYPANRWWMSRLGWWWVTKDIFAWLKEFVFGLHT